MTDAVQPTFLRRLRYTPLTDLLRGRVSGRLDLRTRADLGQLPPAARDLVKRVVKRTRLWRAEKVDVAIELAAHFRDGLAAGDTVEDLAAAFGDERRAAKLIRRAKLRNRPLAWHAVRFLRRLTAALLVVYAVLAARFLLGEPRVTVDYVARLNEPVVAVPEEQRAWPLYGRALVDLGVPGLGEQRNGPWGPDEQAQADAFTARLEARPGGKRWDELGAWVDAHAADVERLRQAAGKPSFGFVLGPNGSQVDWPLNMKRAADEDWGAVGVLLPTLNHSRTLAQVLAADFRVACSRRDGDRAVRDVDAMLSMADQIGGPFVVSQLVGIGIRGMAFYELDRALGESPDLFDDAALVRLAHRLDGVGKGRPPVDVTGERIWFYDVVQRIYTDDGAGDGRLAGRGLAFLQLAGAISSTDGLRRWPNVPTVAVAPLGLVGSRREVVAEYDRLMAITEAQLARPAREADWSPFARRVDELRSSSVLSTRYLPVLVLMPALQRTQVQVERSLGARDGLQVAIALEIFRRRSGRYPATLDALTPNLLPTVPADRITGGPLAYKLVDGRPLVYSVGVDRDDDGGRVAVDGQGRKSNVAAADWPPPRKAADGDWLLFPAYRAEEPADTEGDESRTPLTGE